MLFWALRGSKRSSRPRFGFQRVQVTCKTSKLVSLHGRFLVTTVWRGCSSVVERSLCMWKARGSIPRISINYFAADIYPSSCGRVVKALDLKSNGLCPRRFEPCQLRTVLSSFQPKFAQNYLPPVGFEPTTPSLRDCCSTTELKRLSPLFEFNLI